MTVIQGWPALMDKTTAMQYAPSEAILDLCQPIQTKTRKERCLYAKADIDRIIEKILTGEISLDKELPPTNKISKKRLSRVPKPQKV